MRKQKWGGSRRERAAAILAVLLGAIATGTSALAAGPAVRAFNGRIGAGYAWTHVEDDRSSIGGTAFETDTHQGFISGTMTIPLGDALGLRLNLLPNYAHRDSDSLLGLDLDSDFGGMDAGGSLFWRDPERFELGVEARYSWQEIEFDSFANDQTVHSFEGQWYGVWFLTPDALWPVDLNAFFSYAGVDLDEEVTDEVQEAWSIGGDVRFYPLEVLAFSVGGLYRELDSNGFADTETSGAVFRLDALVHRTPGLTLSPRFEVGNRDTSTFFAGDFEQTYYSVVAMVTMSFPGGNSLVELNRAYY